MAERSKADDQLNDYKKSRAVSRFDSIYMLGLDLGVTPIYFKRLTLR